MKPANTLSDAAYFPVIGLDHDFDHDVLDYSNKPLLPFPKELTEGIDFVFITCVNGSRNYYFISTDDGPSPGDLVCIIDYDIDLDDESNPIDSMSLFIDRYDEMAKFAEKCRELNIENNDLDILIGIVKYVIHMGNTNTKLVTIEHL